MMHPNVKNLLGRTYGHWRVLTRAENSSGRTRWLCRCICGRESIVFGCHLLSGKSTGCLWCRPKGADNARFKHGQADTQMHVQWMGMLGRCRAKTGDNHKNYADRGITVCERWRNSFTAFVEDMGPRPSKRHSIERRDNSRGYSKQNCYWATQKQQMRNMRRNRIVTYKGQAMPLVVACELAGVNYSRTRWRLDNGYSDAEALS